MTAVDRLHRSPSTRQIPRPQGWLGRACSKADISDDHIIGALVWLLAGVGLTGLLALFGDLRVSLVTLIVVVALPSGLLMQRAGRRAERLVASLPATIDRIARSLRSGASFAQSLSEASVQTDSLVAEELRAIQSDVQRGIPISSALRTWAEQAGQAEVRIVASALALASQNEAGSTRALEGVSQSLRDRRALNAEIKALTSQASASLRAMVMLPVGFVLLDALSAKTVVRFLTIEPLGRLCLFTGLALEAAGWLWMRALVQRQLG